MSQSTGLGEPETIFARASGAGRAGVAVWRLSGPQAFTIAATLSAAPLPALRRAGLRTIRDADGRDLDRGLVLLFESPKSFTGEDCVEFHLHGGRAVEQGITRALIAAGAVPAGAGEFTRRALINGRLDLAQVEALADLLDAETDEQRRQALGQLEGRLSTLAEGWRRSLIGALAPLEAAIDFPDEEDVPATIADRASPVIAALIASLRSYQEDFQRRRAIREGVKIAIIGAPNVGKSTLLNRLAGSDLAIVSPIPGTTRDVIEARLDLDGLPALLADTAGLRDEPGDTIEAEGMRRTRLRAEEADLRIVVVDGSGEVALQNGNVSRGTFLKREDGDFLVVNKADLAPGRAIGGAIGGAFYLSALTGEGVEEFVVALTERVRTLFAPVADTGLTRARHAAAVGRAIAALERARSRTAGEPELAAEDVRLAIRALGEITGAVDADAVLAEIFSSFCIGK